MEYIALAIFFSAFGLIIFDLYDKSLIALTGALLMIILGILGPEEAVAAIQYEALLLMAGMMIMVNVASKSGLFNWIGVKIAALTKGNPLALFLFFSLLTGAVSAFLPNVTTMVILVPLTIELLRGMGKDPKPYIFSEIMFANIGGDLTLIGDASNIIIGSASGLGFFEFIQNLWIPILAVSIFTISIFVVSNWSNLKPISGNLVNLFIANIIIRKIKNKFLKTEVKKSFVIKILVIFILSIAGFFLEDVINIPNYIVALVGAVALSLLVAKEVEIEHSLKEIEWSTLFFFSGLFIMVAGVEKTGILEVLSNFIVNSTSDVFYLSLIILWSCGIFSMILENIPFVTVMIPVILGIQARFPGTDTTVLWWALSMGACLGGCGTLIGGSANIVTAGLAKKEGVHISFLEYLRFGLPITFGMLIISSIYLFIRYN